MVISRLLALAPQAPEVSRYNTIQHVVYAASSSHGMLGVCHLWVLIFSIGSMICLLCHIYMQLFGVLCVEIVVGAHTPGRQCLMIKCMEFGDDKVGANSKFDKH